MSETNPLTTAPNPAAPAAAPSPAAAPAQETNPLTAAPDAPAPAPAATDWTAGLDDDAKQLLQQKNWKSPADVLQSYKHLERFIGGDKMPVPKSPEDPAWAVVNKALGVPESPDKYELKQPENMQVDETIVKGFKEIAHKNNIPAAALAKVYDWYTETAAKQQETLNNELKELEQKELGQLKKTWGADYTTNMNIATSTMNQLKIPQNEREALITSIGTKRTAELFIQVGKALGANQTNINTNTIDSKPAPMLDDLKSDPAFAAKFAAGDPEAKKQWLAAINKKVGG
jgi:hypothetical protein